MTLIKRKENVNYVDILKNTETYNACSSSKDKSLMLQYCEEFSEYFFVEDMGGKPVVIRPTTTPRAITNNDGTETIVDDFSYSFMTLTDFKNSKVKSHFNIDKCYKKEVYPEQQFFARFWLETQTDICTSYKRTVFDPNPKFNDPTIFNFWTGFVDPIKGDVTPFLNHIDNLIDGTAEEKAHLIKLLAFTVKYPHIRPDTTIVLQGPQGCGKTTISETMRALCPNHASIVDNLDELLLGFNHEYLHTKYFLHEESIFSGDKKINEAMKPFITGNTRKTRIKNLSSIQIQNYSFHIFTSNSDTPILVENTDRRHNVFLCNGKTKGLSQYFASYYDWLNNGGANALVHFFCNEVNFTNFDPKATIETTAKNMVKANTLNPIESFLFNILAGALDPLPGDDAYSFDKLEAGELMVPRAAMFGHFQNFHQQAGRKIPHLTQNNFNHKIQEIFQFPASYTEWKNKSGRCFKLPQLAKARRLFAEFIRVSDFSTLMGMSAGAATSEGPSLQELVTQPSPAKPQKNAADLEALGIKPIVFQRATKDTEAVPVTEPVRTAPPAPEPVKPKAFKPVPLKQVLSDRETAAMLENEVIFEGDKKRIKAGLPADCDPFSDEFYADTPQTLADTDAVIASLTDEEQAPPLPVTEKLRFGRAAVH